MSHVFDWARSGETARFLLMITAQAWLPVSRRVR